MLRRSRTNFTSRARAVGVNLASVNTAAPSDAHRLIAVPRAPQLRRFTGALLVLVGLVLVGFLVQAAGLSHLKHAREQALLYEEFRYKLADATAPVAQVDADGSLHPLGAPVARLSIPAIGVDEVVVEGTNGRTLLTAPGHRRDTVLPGQSGASVVMGRQATYGGPFGSLEELAVGDRIETTTGQGKAVYEVIGLRREGDPQPAAVAPGEGRLTLVTAGGSRFSPDGVLRIDAELTSTPFATPAPALLVGSLSEAESPLAGDESGWLSLLLSLQVAALALVAFSFLFVRWGRWHTWVVAAPVTFVLGCTIAEQVIVLLPNLF